jgi:hypothetical protein
MNEAEQGTGSGRQKVGRGRKGKREEQREEGRYLWSLRKAARPMYTQLPQLGGH